MKTTKTNYKAFIEEISDEVSEGILTQKDSVQILRADKPIYDNYCPIVDWYHDAYTMDEELNTPLEEMYLEEEFTKEEWEEMKQDQEALKKQYKEDFPKLTSITVKEVLTEMKQIQKLF